MKNEIDLTTGNIRRKLILFALPLLFANLLQSFYSIVDMLVVGRVCGEGGLAAISNASMLCFIINSICIGITMGGTVLAAQYKGAGDEQGQIRTTGTLFTLSFICAIIVTIIARWSYTPLFHAMQVPYVLMKDTCAYMNIISFGTIFMFGYNAVCSIMKGFGDSKSPLYFIVIATFVNVVLDVIFVACMQMGVIGAAYATIISQAVSLIISIWHLKRTHFIFDFTIGQFKMDYDNMKAILNVGIPVAVQMVIVNVSYLIITGMLNTFGVSAAAASGIGLKINTFAGMPCWAIGQAVTAMAGQNIGAGDSERVKKLRGVLSGSIF